MGKTRTATAILCGLLLACAAAPCAFAHHSGAMYDGAHPITLEGTVKAFDWSNPHVSVDLYVDGKDGAPGKVWTVSASAVGVMIRSGWTKRTLNPGDKVKILCLPLRDGGAGGAIVSATLPDGKVISFVNPGRGTN